RVEAVVFEDRLIEVREVPASREVRGRREPGAGAYAADRERVGQGSAARAAGRRHGDVRESEEGCRRRRDRLVERGDGEEPAYHQHMSEVQPTAGADEKGERPDDADVDERLGVGLIGL